jgi:hypothetical protein
VQGRSVPLRRGALDTRPLAASQATWAYVKSGQGGQQPAEQGEKALGVGFEQDSAICG